MLLGEDAMHRLSEAHVVIAGLGAVGGYALEGMARAGVGNLRLVDFDVVSPTNINRQILAMDSTVGKPKVELAASRVKDINPACNVQPMQIFLHTDTLDEILAGRVDLVIDAIDALLPKVELIAACIERKIPIISSMGAALRKDPSAIKVGPLKKATHCALARRVRKMLRHRDLPTDIACVFSSEPAGEREETAIAELEQSEQGVIQRGRQRRTLGSLPTITGIFGLTIANTAIGLLLENQ
jgi:tRNA A37 threonylcarbamoyladenosine dehydratase